MRVAFWSAAIAPSSHLSLKLGKKASVSPEAQQSEDLRGVFGVEEKEGEAEERPEKRQRVARSEDEEDEELLRSGVFDDDVSGDGGDRGERGRSSGEAERRGRSSGSGCGFMEPEEEGRPVRAPNPPYVHTAKERGEHSATHYPPRSWC